MCGVWCVVCDVSVRCGTVRCGTVRYGTVPYRTVPYRTVPYRTVPYRTVPYRTVLYHAVHSAGVIYITSVCCVCCLSLPAAACRVFFTRRTYDAQRVCSSVQSNPSMPTTPLHSAPQPSSAKLLLLSTYLIAWPCLAAVGSGLVIHPPRHLPLHVVVREVHGEGGHHLVVREGCHPLRAAVRLRALPAVRDPVRHLRGGNFSGVRTIELS